MNPCTKEASVTTGASSKANSFQLMLGTAEGPGDLLFLTRRRALYQLENNVKQYIREGDPTPQQGSDSVSTPPTPQQELDPVPSPYQPTIPESTAGLGEG